MKHRVKIYAVVVALAIIGGVNALFVVRTFAQTSEQSQGSANRVEVVASDRDGNTEEQESVRRAQLEKSVDGLIAKARAQKDGLLRVIVHPRGDFESGREMDQSKRKLRINRITSARDDLFTRVLPHARSPIRTYEHAPFIVFEVDEHGLQMLKSLPQIERIEEDVQFDALLEQSTPLIGATNAWSSGHSGKGQVIVVADTGVDQFHPFLVGKVIHEVCFSTGGATSQTLCPNGSQTQEGFGSAMPPLGNSPGYYHGTHVAGIAAGKGVNFSGVAKDAQIIAIQIFHRELDPVKCKGPAHTPCLKANNSDIQAAALWVASNTGGVAGYPIAAMNLSVGGGSYTSNCDDPNNTLGLLSLSIQLSSLKSQGVAVVAASGNDKYTNALAAPACFSSVISVGATTKNDAVANFSNSSFFLDLLAPGVSITSSVPFAQYATLDGTSMAAPHVSGAIAVMKSKAPKADVDSMLSLLKTTGVKILDTKSLIVTPRINLGAAVSQLCSATLSSSAKTFYTEGGSGQFSVTQAGYCSWQPATASSWIKITSPATAVSGNATVSYTVSPWPWSAGGIQTQRTGYITTGGRSYKITQIRLD